jgi:hypothetical protein
MKLSAKQIDYLYQFTRQHYVEWYDLQSELVDHLANAIEEQWQNDPKIPFEEALNKTFKKFGIFGFMDLVEERRKYLDKKYFKLIWSYYKSYFKLPRVAAVLLSVYALFMVSKFIEDPQTFYLSLLGAIVILYLYELVKLNRLVKKRDQITGKKWLLESVMRSNDIVLLSLSVNISHISRSFFTNEWSAQDSFCSAIGLVLLALFAYVKIKIVPAKITDELEKNYSEYISQLV